MPDSVIRPRDNCRLAMISFYNKINNVEPKMYQRYRREKERAVVRSSPSDVQDRSLDRKIRNRECRLNNQTRVIKIQPFIVMVILIALCCGLFSLNEQQYFKIPFMMNKEDINRKIKEELIETDNQCSVYLAPSSLPAGGMGMFTVKKVSKGEIFFPADGPSIPIIDPDDSKRSMDTWVRLFGGYWWENGISDPALFEADHAAEYQITCGALPNSHPFLNNLDVGHPALIPYDDSWMDRTADPGAGANSYYMGKHSIAAIDIEEGEEIFLAYPTEYMNSISKKYNIPNRKHYIEAGKIASTLFSMFGRNVDKWNKTDIVSNASEKTKMLLPKTNDELEIVLSSAKNPQDGRDMSLAIAKNLSVKRKTVSWIREHGMCLDNIVPGISSNPRAGRGAIINRSLKKGDVIAPVPLLQITDRDALRMPAFHGKNWQLLLNYCFGREDTSLLLCPDTNAILINHCSERRPDIHPCGGKANSKPNAKLRWAEWDEKTNIWLNMTIEEMETIGGRGLSLDVVAVEDLNEGDEVFIDYGISFENAWDDHLIKWKPQHYEDNEEWKPAKVLNEELGALPIAPTLASKHITTDDRGLLFTGCYYYEDDDDFWDRFVHADQWNEDEVEDNIQKFGRKYGHEYAVDEIDTYAGDGSFWPCVVIRKDKKDGNLGDTYTVRIIQSQFHKDTAWNKRKLPRIISNYPRKSIRHFYLPYKSDIHLPGVFRHYIELPHDLFQPIWKNRD